MTTGDNDLETRLTVLRIRIAALQETVDQLCELRQLVRDKRRGGQLRILRATLARVEALQSCWLEAAHEGLGSEFAEGCAFAFSACAEQLRDALREPD